MLSFVLLYLPTGAWYSGQLMRGRALPRCEELEPMVAMTKVEVEAASMVVVEATSTAEAEAALTAEVEAASTTEAEAVSTVEAEAETVMTPNPRVLKEMRWKSERGGGRQRRSPWTLSS